MSPDGEAPLPAALMVDDEPEVADAYALRLEGLCDVETAYDGETALELVDEESFDIVLLDRHMPNMSGDEVLESLFERDFFGRTIMVTAIDPGFDVLDMPFDDYLCKPVDREDIRAAVDQQCMILGYEVLGEYFSVESKRAVIEAEISATERDEHPEYDRIQQRAEQLEQRVRRLLDDPEEVFETFERIGREGR